MTRLAAGAPQAEAGTTDSIANEAEAAAVATISSPDAFTRRPGFGGPASLGEWQLPHVFVNSEAAGTVWEDGANLADCVAGFARDGLAHAQLRMFAPRCYEDQELQVAADILWAHT